MQEYNYWGFDKNEPPPNLKTKKQLSEIGLSPLEPVGVIKTPKYNLYLYDPDSSASAKPKRKCGHRALGDCLQALKLLQKIADDDPVFRVPDFLEDK